MNAIIQPGNTAPNMYYDTHFRMQAAKILPGEYFATSGELVIVTVLGSCVAACIRDRASGVGGMNHFMLPENGLDSSAPAAPSARYGTHAMEMLLNEIGKRGARRGSLEAKVFGGGAVIPGLTQSNVGGRNSSFVLDFLAREGIPVIAQDLLGDCPRKVYFFPQTGRAVVKKLASLNNDTIEQREREYRQRLQSGDVAGDVELF